MYIDNIFIFFPPEPLGQFQPNLCKASLSTFMDEQNSSLNKLVLFNSHKRDNSFFYRNQRYGLIIWLYYVVIDWNCFLGKRCGLFKD